MTTTPAMAPRADAADVVVLAGPIWLGEAGPGPSCPDRGSGGPQHDFTTRNTTFLTHHLMQPASLLEAAGGVPAYGNRRNEWDARCAPDQANPEHR